MNFTFPLLAAAERSSSGTLLGRPEGGAPTKLTVARARIICEALAEGMSYAVAASRAGIGELALRRWREKGANEEHPIYVEFVEQVERANAAAEERHLTNVDDAAFGRGDYDKPHWQASGWRLERRWPERYGRRSVHQIEGHDGGPVKFELSVSEQRHKLSAEDKERLEAARARRAIPARVLSEVVVGDDVDDGD